MESNYNKSYWRVDVEYETIKYVTDVSDQAPVGVWIPAIGQPYAYVETEQEAKAALKSALSNEVERLNKLIEGL